MVTGDVGMRVIVTDLVLQWYFSWMQWCGAGGRNCHGAKVLWCDFIFLAYLDTGMFLYMAPCNVTVLLLTGTWIPRTITLWVTSLGWDWESSINQLDRSSQLAWVTLVFVWSTWPGRCKFFIGQLDQSHVGQANRSSDRTPFMDQLGFHSVFCFHMANFKDRGNEFF
jgi:hypothetical protein